MANPLAGMMRGTQTAGFNNLGDFMTQFQNFRRSFKGDPTQMINEALASGKVTQAQVDEATNTARQIMGMLGGMF